MLTARQRDVLSFIRDFAACGPYLPTYQEIASGCDFSSTTQAYGVVTRLVERGFLVRHDRRLYFAPPRVRGIAVPVAYCPQCDGDMIPVQSACPGCGWRKAA